MSLFVPLITDEDDTLGAALKYAEAGWYVLPVSPTAGKHPGSVVGKGWQHQSSRDPHQIAAWFAGTDYLIALHCGRSGAVVADVDHWDKVPDALHRAIKEACPPHQSSRPDEPGRGHWIFAQPTGRTIGNGSGRLGKAFGEIRGKNGVIIVAPSRHKDAVSGARYQWLQTGVVPELPGYVAELLSDATEAVDAATDEEVARFIATHTAAGRPGKLRGPLTKFAQHLAQGDSRHESMTSIAAWAMREVLAGTYTASEAVTALRKAFIEAMAKSRDGVVARGKSRDGKERTLPATTAQAEADGILAWAIAQAEFEGPQGVTGEEPPTAERAAQSSTEDDGSEITVVPFPVLPKKSLFGLPGDVVNAVLPHTEAHPAALLATFLARFGTTIGNGPHVLIDNREHPARLWPLIIGKTSDGAKGTSYGAVNVLFVAMENTGTTRTSGGLTLFRRNEPLRCVSGLSSGEGLIELVRDPKGDPEEKDFDEGVEDKRLLVVEQEFTGALAVMDRQGSTLPRVVREAWDGDVLRTLTRSALTATGAHISLIGHATPGELRIRLKEAQMLGGTMNRLVPIASRRTKLLADGGNVPEPVIKDLADRIADAVRRAGTVREVKRSDDAVDLWREEYPNLRRSRPDGPVATLLARAAPQVLRTALCYAVACGSDVIERDHLEAALGLWSYIENSAEWLFGAHVDRGEVDELVQYIEAGKTTGRTKSDIRDFYQRNKSAAEINAALSELIKDGRIRQETDRSRPGRPPVRFFSC